MDVLQGVKEVNTLVQLGVVVLGEVAEMVDDLVKEVDKMRVVVMDDLSVVKEVDKVWVVDDLSVVKEVDKV